MAGVWRGLINELTKIVPETLSLRGSALPFGIAADLLRHEGSRIFIAPSEESAAGVLGTVECLLGEDSPLQAFPCLTDDPYGPLAPHPAVVAERASSLTKILHSKRMSLVVSPQAFLWKVPKPGTWRDLHVLLEEDRE